MMAVPPHLVMVTLLVLLSLAAMTAGGPQPGLDVESVADKIIKKIGEKFILLYSLQKIIYLMAQILSLCYIIEVIIPI